MAHTLPYSYFGTHHVFGLPYGFASTTPTSLAPGFPFPACALHTCPHSSVISRYRNFNLLSIGYVFRPGLGPDLPRADQLYSGNLRYSAGRILTFLSLLIPAFSLLYSPQLLIGTASSRIQCSSTNVLGTFLSFGSVFQPRTFSAQDLSTSELLRTL